MSLTICTCFSLSSMALLGIMERQMKFHRIGVDFAGDNNIKGIFQNRFHAPLHPALPGAQSPAFIGLRYIVELDFNSFEFDWVSSVASGKRRHTEADILPVRRLLQLAAGADSLPGRPFLQSSEVEVSTCSMAVTPAVYSLVAATSHRKGAGCAFVISCPLDG